MPSRGCPTNLLQMQNHKFWDMPSRASKLLLLWENKRACKYPDIHIHQQSHNKLRCGRICANSIPDKQWEGVKHWDLGALSGHMQSQGQTCNHQRMHAKWSERH